jgi:hypothetical protein
MRLLLAGSLVLVTMVSSPLAQAEQGPEEAEPGAEAQALVLGVDLLPRVGTSTFHPDRPRHLSVNLLGGLSGGARAFEVGYFFNLASGPVKGVQIAGGASVNGASFDGLQVAGGANVNAEGVRGLQIAGGANVSAGSVNGLQTAGGANVSGADVRGVMLAGGANVTQGAMQGLTMAGGANVAGGDVDGWRMAWGANVSGGDAHAVQLAMGANVTRGDFKGVQLAVANVTLGDMQGVQIGLVNVSRTANASIGLVNIHLDGYVEPELYTSEEGLVMAGIRHGSGSFFNTYSLGKRLYGSNIEWSEIAAAVGFGWRFELATRLELSLEYLWTSIMREPQGFYWTGDVTLHKLRPMVHYELLDRLAIFGGPTMTFMTAARNLGVEGADYAPFVVLPLGNDWWAWPGVTLGLRIQ